MDAQTRCESRSIAARSSCGSFDCRIVELKEVLQVAFQALPHLRSGKAGNSNDLLSAGFAAGDANRRLGDTQQLGHEFDARPVRPALDGRRGERELERI